MMRAISRLADIMAPGNIATTLLILAGTLLPGSLAPHGRPAMSACAEYQAVLPEAARTGAEAPACAGLAEAADAAVGAPQTHKVADHYGDPDRFIKYIIRRPPTLA